MGEEGKRKEGPIQSSSTSEIAWGPGVLGKIGVDSLDCLRFLGYFGMPTKGKRVDE